MNTDELQRATARQLAQALIHSGRPETTGDLARLLAGELPQPLHQGVLDALSDLDDQHRIDELWEAWSIHRLPALETVLLDLGRPAAYPLSLKVLSALALDRLELLQPGQPAIVEPLLLVASDADSTLAGRAMAALRELQDPQAQEELCRWVIERDLPTARQAALEAGYAPQDPRRRALYFLLTSQWEQYEGLDFDRSLLQAVYAGGDENLRTRVAERARQSGWRGFVEVVAGSRRPARQLNELAGVEWEVVLAMLGRHNRWAEAWRLAQSAPPRWSARLLRDLQEAGWSPAQAEEQAGYRSLHSAARRALDSGAPAGALAQYTATLEGHKRAVTALVFEPHARWIASSSADTTIRLWDLPGGAPLTRLEGHTNFVLSLAVAPGGELLASGGADKTVRLWRLPAGQPVQTLGGLAGEAAAVAISPDGSLLAGADRGLVRLWSLPELRPLHQLRARMGSVISLRFVPGSRLLISQDDTRSVHFWELPGGALLRTLLESAAAWDPNPKGDLLATASNYGRLRLWSLPGGELSHSLKGRADGNFLVFSPTGEHIAASDGTGVRVWQPDREDPVAVVAGHTRPLSALAIARRGSLLASGSEDRTIRLWSLPGGELCAVLDGPTAPVRQLAFSPDGAWLASSDENTVRLWRLNDINYLLETAISAVDPETARWVEELSRRPELTVAQQAWLDFTLALLHFRRRFDIEISEAPQHIAIGEFDIEIES